MRFKKPIFLPILFNTDETISLSNLGLEVDDERADIKKMPFYSIDAIEPIEDGGVTKCNIHVSGESFACPVGMHEVVKMIGGHEDD